LLEGCPEREAASLPGSGSPGLKRPQAEQGQPVRVASAGHQLPRALASALLVPAAQEAAVVQKEPQQLEVGAAEVPAQGEVAAQPRVQVLPSELLRGVSAMDRLTAANRAWNVPPSCARGRFHPRAVQRCRIGRTESDLQQVRAEARRLRGTGIPEPANV
jgi:hypothetical protein